MLDKSLIINKFCPGVSFLLLLFVFISEVNAQTESVQQIVTGDRANSVRQQEKPYLILISADGFRHDYVEKFQANRIKELGKRGVKAAYMMPSFPSLTFPNHYTLVTGMYPAHHGLIGNNFYDPLAQRSYSLGDANTVRDSSWYGGTPLWVLAEQQGMLAASLFWVGSEAAVQDVRPSYYYNYTEKISMKERIQVVVDWLSLPEEVRPHLITFYLSEPDHSGHRYGPDAPETAAAVKRVDSTIYALTKAVEATGLPVNFVFTSDHGMTNVVRDNPIPVPKILDSDAYIVPALGSMLEVHVKDKKRIQSLYDSLRVSSSGDYQVYLKSDIPKHLYFNEKHDRFERIGDIILLAKWPRVFSRRPTIPGYHGFDPQEVPDMRTIFYAWGPAFKSGLEISSFENIHVYPLVTNILGLKHANKIDGKKRVLKKIMK